MVKRLPTMWETRVQSLGQEDLLEEEMATHSSILAWKIPWMEKPGRLQSMGSQRVWHDWVTLLTTYLKLSRNEWESTRLYFLFFFAALSRAMHQFGKVYNKNAAYRIEVCCWQLSNSTKIQMQASEYSVILHQVPKHLLTEIISTLLSTVFLLLVYFYLCKMLIHCINVSRLCRKAFYILPNSRY